MIDPSPNHSSEWTMPSSDIELAPEEVHVWRGFLDRSPSDLQAFWETLSPAEQERAIRFASPHHQNHFIVAHGMVRHILAFYANTTPAGLVFGKGLYGKPYFAAPTTNKLFFNLSHSNTLLLLAVTSLGEVGVDVEYHRSTVDFHALAKRIMKEEEQAQFRTIPGHQQQGAFFSYWTRKEAFVKALGKGLGEPSPAFPLSVNSPDYSRRVILPDPLANGRDWSMYEIFPETGYSAALAVIGLANELRFWHFPPDRHFP